jgi:asparagine synthase (glutamine-hydrolysing)
MCGIAGRFCYGHPQNSDKAIIQQMTDALSHRGPDADGFFLSGPIALGHRRLSIIDLTEKANQPIFDAKKRYAIIFNGEIYNYAELKSKLKNYPFQTKGDTEVVLAAYINWGPRALDELRGMFAFAIWDELAKELFVARDRMGVKPVYYYHENNQFLFASEIRAILASGLVKRRICRTSLADYFSYQSFQSPQTIIENIRELPAGHYMTINDKAQKIVSYWKIEGSFERTIADNDKKTIETRVRDLLLKAVQRRMVSDVPVAAFLSGGIDSSVVVGLMAQIADAPETFNIAFDDKEFNESEYAALVSKKFNTRHHEILLKPEVFLEELPNALNAMDSPSGDGINTYVVSKAIRKEGIKVALSGVGGDELFVGYPIFQQWKKIYEKKWLSRLPGALRSVPARFLHSSDIRKQRLAQLITLSEFNIGEVYPVLRQVNADSTIRSLLKSNVNETQLRHSLKSIQGSIEKFPLYSQLSIAEYLGYTQQTLLKDTDQMSMAVSLEVREPFFDHDLIEYVLNVPDEFKTGRLPKSLLIAATGNLIPQEVYQRPKKGFVFPWNKWFRSELKTYCAEKINLLAQRDFVDGYFVKQYWNDFLEYRNQIGWTNILLLVALENYADLHNLS